MLCGLHCINALLQGPIFDEVTLSQIAIALDQEERQLLAGENSQFFQESANVANDGSNASENDAVDASSIYRILPMVPSGSGSILVSR